MIQTTSTTQTTRSSSGTSAGHGSPTLGASSGGAFASELLEAARATRRGVARGASDAVEATKPEPTRRGRPAEADPGRDPLMAQVAAQTDATKLATAELASADESESSNLAPRPRVQVVSRSPASGPAAREATPPGGATQPREPTGVSGSVTSRPAIAGGATAAPTGVTGNAGVLAGRAAPGRGVGLDGVGALGARAGGAVHAVGGRVPSASTSPIGERLGGTLARMRTGIRGQSPPSAPSRTPEEALRAQAMRGLAGVLRQKGGTVTMRLAPEELGELRVRMKLDGSRVEARIEAGSDRARELLGGELPALRAALESQGLVVQRLELDRTPAEPVAARQAPAGVARRGEGWGARREGEREEQSSLAEPGDVEFVWLDGRVDRMA